MLFNQLYNFKHAASGQVLLNSLDQHQTPAVKLCGEYSEGEVDVFRAILKPNSVVIEVGACFGLHTLALAELVGQGKVLALEPQFFNYQVLVANLALNSVLNVIPRQAAAGATCGTCKVPIYSPEHSNNFGQMPALGHTEGTAVDLISIDSINLGALTLIKIDCEGNEPEVLEGAKHTISTLKPWIYLEFTDNREKLLSFFREMGYLCKRHMPYHTRQPNHLGADLSGKVIFGSDMLLAWPSELPQPIFPADWREPDLTDILSVNTNNVNALTPYN